MFNYLKHFDIKEKWGKPDMMYFPLLATLDLLRDKLEKPININAGYAEDGHSPNSKHYQGKAADFHLKESIMTAAPLICNILERANVTYGLGIYPEWNRPGFHLDLRDKTIFWVKTDKYYYFNTFIEAYNFLRG